MPWKYRIWVVTVIPVLISSPLSSCFQLILKARRNPSDPHFSSKLYYGVGGGGNGPSTSGESTSPVVDSSSSTDTATHVVEGDQYTTSPVDTINSANDSSADSSTDPSSDNIHDNQESAKVSTEQNENVRFIKEDIKNMTAHILDKSPPDDYYSLDEMMEAGTLSRRDALRRTATLIVAGAFIGGGTIKHQWDVVQQSSKKIGDLNYTRIIKESAIEISVDGPMNREFLNAQTFQKVQTLKLPGWVPSFLVPPPQVIHDTTNTELLTAAAIAGSVVEMARTSLLYPLLTLKTRVQTDVNVRIRKRRRNGHSRRSLDWKRRLRVAQLLALKHVREGRLYAGILPSLLISVPATGVYFGVRDVVVRKLVPYTDTLGGSISVALLAALVADVVSLLIRTPADTLAVRLQAATGEEFRWEDSQDRPILEVERQAYLQEKIGDWFLESFERIPAVIVTDLPYLLSRIVLTRLLLQGGPVSLGRYEGIVLFSALLCGFLTTPFDVARTRILVDSDDDPTNGADGGSGDGLFKTFEKITNEADGGIRNLFAGWIERVVYLGIGRAWIEPLQILGYIAIRDFILLEWF